MPIRIFVSHASADVELVGSLVRALEAALVVEDGSIRCTSLPGYRLRSGTHTSTALRAELAAAALIIGVLTPESVESGWVMFELGAAWGANKWVVPVLVGVAYDSLPGPLKESNATDATNQEEVGQLFAEIAEELALKPRPFGRATRAVDELIEAAEGYETVGDKDEDEDEEALAPVPTSKSALSPAAAWPFPTDDPPKRGSR